MKDKISVIQVGGSIEKAIKGEYQLDVAEILKEAWQLTRQSRTSIVLGLLFVFFIGAFISYFMSLNTGGIESLATQPELFLIVQIAVTLITAPFLAGVEMMGVLHAFGIKTQPKMVFAFLKRGSWVALCALLTSLLNAIGFQLLILPGIFLAIALCLTIPLVVEKKLSPMRAIVVSIQATRHQWFKIFALHLVLICAVFITVLPISIFASMGIPALGIAVVIFAFTFIAPMYYNVKGILYREIFGMQLKATDAGNEPTDHTFSA